ncbi:hypothetical protein VD0004_g8534 [Verticillium dahliae]|uniref:Uncharacterized protein n=1 Tax=Verticillium dahliae TaxID=27337 RepID=A0A444S456_VERDA|nr:hypothetical protein VD0004_g8534 [Verticillium dahliae]PNH65533.1 hypothetical protein VD0001_g8464 [Verticillium dahliae]RXG48180.1 hypothetical protein VDGE_01792 [Verticillium dahliae]
MAIQGINRPIPGEVTVASSAAGAPRLDFPRFSFFGQDQDDAEKSALPRTKSSGDIVNMAINSAEEDEDHASQRISLDEGSRIRARDNGERSDISELIQFLRTESPPPHNYLASAFDEDADMVEDIGKWRQLRKRIRAKLNKPTPTLSVETRPRTALPDSAVASKTSSGHSHIAISIPMEHCHLGPDSDWAVTAFNATKPLPPSPPPDPRTSSGSRDRSLRPRHEHGSVSAPGTAHGDSEWLSMMKASKKNAMPKMEPKSFDSSVLLWQRDIPLSPPRSPPSTASGSTQGQSPSTPAQLHRAPMPMDPNDHVEVPRSSTSSPKTPETIMEDRLRKVHVSWMTTSNMLQSAPGPPPRSASSASPRRAQRPEEIKLPTRKSSLRTPIAAAMSSQNQWSIDGMLETQQGQTTRLSAPIELPELSPSALSFSEKSIATSIVSEGSEPVVQNAREVRGHSNASVVLQTTPGATPRASLIQLPASKYSPPVAAASPLHKAARRAPAKMSTRRQSRAERVKSLKQRDMELARAQLSHIRQTSGSTQSGGRPRTAGTSISSLRLPSREGPLRDGPLLSDFTNQFPRPPTADRAPEHIAYSLSREQESLKRSESMSLTPQPEAEAETEAEAEADAEAGSLGQRDSTMSFEPPRRYNSYQRTSWASSIPLLDRISSYAPSEASFMNILDSVSSDSNPHRRSDSATLPRIEQERLAPSRLSYMVPVPDMEPVEDVDQATESAVDTGASSEPPVLQPISRLSAMLPMSESQPLSVYVERWSASTLTSRTDDVIISFTPTSEDNRRAGEAVPRWNVLDENHNEPQLIAPSSSLVRLETEAGASGQWPGHQQLQPRTYREPDTLPEVDAYHRDHLVPQRGPHALLRMSSSELRAHYASLRRSERTSDLAHHMLLNQERLELDIRRQERNQMFFIGRLQRALDDLGTRMPARVPGLVGTSSAWSEGEVEQEAPALMGERTTPRRARMRRTPKPVDESVAAAECERGRRRGGETRPWTAANTSGSQQQRSAAATNTGGLDAMEPLMRELHGAARVSLEQSDRRWSRTLESSTTTTEERALNAYLNMF